MKTIAIIAVALSQLVWPVGAATWNSDGSRASVQSIHDAGAADGDTITIPSGTFEWTTGVTLTKAITLAGLGTVTKDVNNRATVCGTKIKCSVPGSVISWKLVANKTSRMTGIEFVVGSTYAPGGTVFVEGLNTDNRRIRIDNCVFNQLNNYCLSLNTVLGVVDHCSFYCSFSGWYTVDAASWNGTQGVDSFGNGSWAESENYGSDRSTFFEDNTFVGEYCRSSSTVTITASGNVTFTVPAGLAINNGQPITATFWDTTTGKPDVNFAMYGTVNSYNGTTLVMSSSGASGAGSSKSYWTLAYRNSGSDGQRGCRQVVRHNIFSNGAWQNHGLEANATRGGRVVEFYNNEMYGNTSSASWMFFRSGTGLLYNNTLRNFQASTPLINLVNYSSLQDAAAPWGGPDGRNPWHANAAAAIVTGTVTSVPATFSMRDNTKTWTLNQYQNYTIRATSGISVSSMTRSGSTVTVTTSGAHGLTTGDKVSIMGADQHWYNKLYGSCTVSDSTHFTVTLDANPPSPATGTIKCRKNGFYGHIRSSATDGTVTWSSGVNGADYTLQLQVGDTYEINQVGTVMDQCGMGAGSMLTLPLIANPPAGWPNQAISPVYQWNNGAVLFDTRIDFAGATYATIVPGRNYTNAVFSYTPYTYPHPLVSGTTNIPSGNSPPTVSGIADQIATPGVTLGPLSFTVADAETAAGNLSVIGSAANPILVPTGNLVVGGSGGDRTLSVTPATGVTGTTTITITVSDGEASAVTSFVLSVNTAQPGRLVAAYSFSEGTGLTVADLSGNANAGTLSGATWTAAGKYGSGLSFGGSGRVIVPDSSSLDLTTGMTIEAWVYPTVLPSNWSPIVMKERTGDLAYALYAGSPANVPYAQIYTTSKSALPGSSGLPLNSWSHLALTYDGATLRMFVNGSQVASQSSPGSLITSTGVLSIGGEGVWGNYFRGTIDEVRIYNRALGASEIQSDMNTQLVAVGAPQTPKGLHPLLPP